MKREWVFSLNTFEINTRGSHKKALMLFTDTYSKLKNELAEPEIAMVFPQFETAFRNYEQVYQEKQMIVNTYEGKTMLFETLLTDLTQMIRRWEGKVRAEFPEDSPTEREIFPNKRSPFISGTYENRRMAVGVLAIKLQEYDEFSGLSNEVRTFYEKMDKARDSQQQMEGKSAELSDKLEQARLEVCEMMYAALGILMFKHHKTPSNMVRYFDLSLLRRTGSSDAVIENTRETKTINAEQVVSLGEAPDKNQEIYLHNAGNAALQLCCSDFQDITDPITYTLEPGATFLNTYGNLFLSDKKYWLVKNTNGEQGLLEFAKGEVLDDLE